MNCCSSIRKLWNVSFEHVTGLSADKRKFGWGKERFNFSQFAHDYICNIFLNHLLLMSTCAPWVLCMYFSFPVVEVFSVHHMPLVEENVEHWNSFGIFSNYTSLLHINVCYICMINWHVTLLRLWFIVCNFVCEIFIWN
jgi:hypothetical protein